MTDFLRSLRLSSLLSRTALLFADELRNLHPRTVCYLEKQDDSIEMGAMLLWQGRLRDAGLAMGLVERQLGALNQGGKDRITGACKRT